MSTGDFTETGDRAAAPLPGERLAAARESRGMTVAEIAQQLKLSPWQVEALEAGNTSRLPSAVFVRGFIRNYARLVKLDPKELLAYTEPAAPAPVAPAHNPSAEIPFPTKRRVNWWPYAAGAVAVVAALAVYEFYPEATSVSPAPSAEVQSAPSQTQVAMESTPVRTDSAAPATAAGAPASAVAPAEAAAAPVKAPPADRAEEQAGSTPVAGTARVAGEQVVRMHFKREAWVEIRDRNGRKIFSQLNAPGTDQTVSGLPPLSLVVGNANGVQLTHNEQLVDLARYTKVDVARLTLE